MHFAVLQDLYGYWKQFNPVVSLKVVPFFLDDSTLGLLTGNILALFVWLKKLVCPLNPLYRFLSAGYVMEMKHPLMTLLSGIDLCSVMKSHLVLSDFDSVNANFKSNLKINF
jgi:hypothetical protein